MNHWLFHAAGCISAIGLACLLEWKRSVWYGKHHALIAAGGFLMAAGWLMAMFVWSTDLPRGSASSGVWWAAQQFWIMFGLTMTPIVIWDQLFVTTRHATETEQLRAALREALAEIKTLRASDEHQDAT